MKYAALFMVFVLLLSLAGAGWVYLTASVSVTAAGVTVMSAADDPETFADLKQRMAEKSVAGTVFDDSALGEAADYRFLTLRVQLKNSTWLDAEQVELQVVPRDGDVLQMGTDSTVNLKARSSGFCETTVLTSQTSYAGHEVMVTYYLWGQPFTLTANCNN